LFKIIPVKKQGKYNLNVQLQDLGAILIYIKGFSRRVSQRISSNQDYE